MKKFYAILIAAFALVSLHTKAQIACDASFTAQFLSGSTVKFNPMPSTLDSVSVNHFWSFGEVGGGYFNYSYSVSPINTFPTGTFSVGHRIYRTNPNGGAVCTDSSNQTITITQGACLLSASYVRYIDPSNILQRYYYNQTNYLSATDSIRWTFGDGTSANSYNATHTFANPGVYNVCLRVIKRNANGTLSNCVSEICRLDTVAYQCNIQAYFTSSSDSATAPATIQFNNQTVNYSPTDSITWNFGDGSAVSHAVNPFHIYTTAGTYTVCMRVKRNTTVAGAPPCISEYCKQITITGPPCNLVANFTWYRDSIITIPNSYHFTNTTIPLAASDSIRWTFGDGTSSNQVNPTHVYTTTGTFNVCLRVIKRNPNGILTNCISEKCHVLLVSPPINICNLQAYFTSIADSAQLNVIHFTNQSPGYLPTDSVSWNFGDGTPILFGVNNPTHTYAIAGTYTVCIKIKRNTPAGTVPCIREYCKVVIITIPCNLVANFTWYRDSLPTAPANTYHFVNTSAPLSSSDSIRWTFGDGTSSNQINPTHVYAQAGTYTVCLRVQKRNANGILTNCVKEKCYTIVVPPINICNLQAYFTSIADSAQPNIIHFTNQSPGYLPTDSVSWNFGDGSPILFGVNNPTHTYATAGTYTVCIKIKRNTPAGTVPCIREYCKVVIITIPCNLVANFTWYRDSLATALNTYHFVNTSAPLTSSDSIRWTFGDGTSSNQVNPTHVYAQAGTYTVCLRVQKRNANGILTNCVKEKCYTVVVAQTCTLQSNFTSAATTANYKTIVFTNTTIVSGTGATALWSFGDGTSATTWNATHTYAQAGRYAVCLRTQIGTCISYKCDSITIIAPTPIPTCTQLSNYTFISNNGIVNFTTTFATTGVLYTWTFGDGTGAIGANASHQYTSPGYYTACLTAYKNNNCASTTCKTIYIAPNCNNIILAINNVRDSLVPNRIKFTALSNIATTNQVWTITKIPTTATTGTVTINANNPTYMFLDSGYYNVCVKATFANGCVKTICKVVYISQNMPVVNNCTLQIYPNPASSIINANITLVQPLMLNAYVYNSMNVLVAQKQQQGIVGNNTVSINIANLPAGIYILRLVYGNQLCYATFIKQ